MNTAITRVQLAAVLVLTIVGVASADELVAGWDRTRWGMSSSDIQKAYPEAKPDKRRTYNLGGRMYYSDLALPGIRVGGYDFTVRFLMAKSDALTAVQLGKDFDKDMSSGKIAYDTVKELLIQKYGRPTTEEHSDSTENLRLFKSVWHSSNAQITFKYVSIPPTQACFINLTYAKPGDTDKL